MQRNIKYVAFILALILALYVLFGSRIALFLDIQRTIGVKLPMSARITKEYNLKRLATAGEYHYGIIAEIPDCAKFSHQNNFLRYMSTKDSLKNYFTPFYYDKIDFDYGILLIGPKLEVGKYGLGFLDTTKCIFYFEYVDL